MGLRINDPSRTTATTPANDDYLLVDGTTNGTRNYSMSKIPTISSGTVAPTSTPAKIGDKFINTSTKDSYKSAGTSSSADWVEDDMNSRQTIDRIYDGVDLSTKFASEISAHASVWAWIKARIQSGNFNGIHVGDYIPFTLSAGTITNGTTPYTFASQAFNAQIAGIDTYYGYGDTAVSHHIDFITKNVLNTSIPWQSVANNNATSLTASPWLSSMLYAILNGINNYTTSAYGSVAHGYDASSGGILQLMPSALQDVIITKRHVIETRYSASGLLTESNSSAWVNMGKLWAPTEQEIFGASIMPLSTYMAGTNTQYPIFANNIKGRIKTNSSGTQLGWWTSVAANNSSNQICTIVGGIQNSPFATNVNRYSPICFRIA